MRMGDVKRPKLDLAAMQQYRGSLHKGGSKCCEENSTCDCHPKCALQNATQQMTSTSNRARWLNLAAILVTVLGLGITIALVAAVGFDDVLGVLRRMGSLGFLAYTAFSFVILAVLGMAWFVLAPGESYPRISGFFWARLMREAATDVLPFSQFGGIVVGARALTTQGVPQPMVYASMIADQTAELMAQLAYTLYGVGVLAIVLSRTPTGGDLLYLAIGGLGVSIAIIAAFAFAQRPLLVLAARIGGTILPQSAIALASVHETLSAIYSHRKRLILAFLLHSLAWVASGAGGWIALHLLGVPISVGSVIVIESLIFTLRTAAFMVPGAIGLQEGAYLLIGPLFGLPPEAALALSLAKRARDLAIGVPAMIIWQLGEGRALVKG